MSFGWPPVSDSKNPYNPDEAKLNKPIRLSLQCVPELQGALISIEPETGDVVAMVGGYSFQESQFNRATQAFRQPGSSFKPIVYSAALDNGFTAASVILDAPVVQFLESGDVWRPSNYEKNFKGPLLLRTALALSRNLCTIRVVQQMGVQKVIERAKDLELEPHFPEVLSVSLGAGRGYAAEHDAGLHRLRQRRHGQQGAVHPLGQELLERDHL